MFETKEYEDEDAAVANIASLATEMLLTIRYLSIHMVLK